jgi:hypothetical protein
MTDKFHYQSLNSSQRVEKEGASMPLDLAAVDCQHSASSGSLKKPNCWIRPARLRKHGGN